MGLARWLRLNRLLQGSLKRGLSGQVKKMYVLGAMRVVQFLAWARSTSLSNQSACIILFCLNFCPQSQGVRNISVCVQPIPTLKNTPTLSVMLEIYAIAMRQQ